MSIMNSRIITFRLGFALLVATSFPARSQNAVVNGDFWSGLNDWTLVQPPANIVVAAQPGLFDLSSSGPLSTGNDFYAHVGYDSLVNLQQTVFLTAGGTYNFYADIATTTPLYNVDNGTISVFVDGNGIASYSFGAWINTISSISGAYTPVQSGNVVLSIDFSRSYLADDMTPTDWIDNIALTAVPEPRCLGLALGGSILIRVFRNNLIFRLLIKCFK
jgi:hypothetical protein